jgi:hypothetical protein
MARDIKVGSVPSELLTRTSFRRDATAGVLASGVYDQIIVPTSLLPQGGFIWDLVAVEVNFDAALVVAAAGSVSIEVTLSRSPKVAMSSMNDADIIARSKQSAVVAAAGTPQLNLDMPLSLQFEGDALVAGANVYVGILLTNASMAVAAGVSGLISYTTRSMPKDRILEVLFG